MSKAQAPPRPRSAVSVGVGVSGMIGLFSWFAIARHFGMDGPNSALMNLVWCGAPMVAWSILVDKVHLNPSTGIEWSGPAKPWRETLDVSLTKLAGLWATWAGIATIYCIFRMFWQGNYRFAMEMMEIAALPLFALSIPYILWIDRRLIEPRDGAYKLGSWLMGQDKPDWPAIQHHLRSWGVKGFFIAFMLSIVPGGFAEAVNTPMESILNNPAVMGKWLIGFMFVIDIAFATVGYLLTFRPLDSHIRSASPTMAGWCAALICYPPFALMGGGGPLDYHQNTADWVYWLSDHPSLYYLWGGTLVFLTAIYAWATMAFGIRFSNLTSRGVMTHGPYALTKHPAYLSKNLLWWLETLPFMVTTHSMVDAIRNTAIMACVSGVYYWRAKTEEAHLTGDDPAYAPYAAWMAEHGPVTSRINRLARRLFHRGRSVIEAPVLQEDLPKSPIR